MDQGVRSNGVDLARESDFAIGGMSVRASACEIEVAPGTTERIEPRVMQVLIVLVRAGGAVVPRDELVEHCWGGLIVSDDAVNRVLSKIRRLSRAAPGAFRVETIPKIGYRLVTPVLLEDGGINWIDPGLQQDLPTPPLPTQREGDAGEIRAAQRGRGKDGLEYRLGRNGIRGRAISGFSHTLQATVGIRWILLPTIALAAVGIVAVIFFASRGPTRGEAAAPARIEIRPFRIVSNGAHGAGLSALADNLPANISTVLSVNGIEAAPSGPDADKWKAGFYMDGMVESDTSRHRVTVRLRPKSAGTVIWSHVFERDASAAFDFSDQIAAQTANVLTCAFGIHEGTIWIAYDRFRHYLSFCAAVQKEAPLDLAVYSRRILKSDPGNPKIMAFHAVVLCTAPVVHWRTESGKREWLARKARAQKLARQALTISPEEPAAQAALAMSIRFANNWAETEDGLTHALSSDWAENSRDWVRQAALLRYAFLLQHVGRLQEAMLAYEKVVSADPLNVSARTKLAWVQIAVGYRNIAEANLDRVERENPDWSEAIARRFQYDLFYRDPADALPRLNNRLIPWRSRTVAERNCYETYVRVRANSNPEIALLAAACTEIQPDFRVRMFSILGDLDRAFAAAEELEPEIVVNSRVLFYPELRAFRHDPRFWPLAAKFGLVDYWLDTDRWPDFCRETDVPFDCRERAREVRTGPAQGQ